MTTANDVVRTETLGAVTVIHLHRPHARNALNRALAQGVCDALAAAHAQRAVVLTGTDPAFCAGLDLRELGVERLVDLPDSVSAVAASEIPVICAANGPAVTGGFELALACDFIVASERATFADTHLRVGVFPGSVLLELPRRIGMAAAREMSLTGDFVDARRALELGLVNRVVAHERVVESAIAVAQSIAEQDPALVRAARAAWRETENLPRTEAQRVWASWGERIHGAGPLGTDIARHRSEIIQRAHDQRTS